MKQPAGVQPSQILRRLGTFVLGVILFATAPSSVCAQELLVSAAVGVYTPLVEVFATSARQVRKNTTDVYAGVRVGIAHLGRFGFEGTVGLSPSNATLKNNPGFPDIEFDDRLLVGSIKATFDVLRFGRSHRVFVAAGGAVIVREEESLPIENSFESVTSYGAVVAADAVFMIAERLGLRADIEDYGYTVGLPDAVLGQASFRTQHDLVLSVGLVFAIPVE